MSDLDCICGLDIGGHTHPDSNPHPMCPEHGYEPKADRKALAESRLTNARWTLLQTLVDGLRCVNPDRFQRDCGKCFICRCRYRDGALVGYLDAADHATIPGTPEMREQHEEFMRQLDQARDAATKRRRGF